jgi:uncharacterized membrane protein
MMKKIVTLGLGALLSVNMMVPSMASEIDQKVDSAVEITQDVQRGNFQFKDRGAKSRLAKQAKPLTQEEHIARIEKGLEQLEEKYEAGNIEEERYNQIKEKMAEAIEAIKNGEKPNMGRKGFMKHSRNLSPEEMLEKLNEHLAELETRLSEDKIEQDQYDSIKEKITKAIEAVENGEKPEMGRKRPFFKNIKNLSLEEILEKLNERLEELEERLNSGEITEERYEDIKQRMQENIQRVENGETILRARKGRRINGGINSIEEKSL